MRNLSKLYYKTYFNNGMFRLDTQGKLTVTLNSLKENNDKLTAKGLLQPIPNECANKEHSFNLTVLYPGLITGVGINHEVNVEGEFKLGIHFDYITGMPIIYGSSVKGVLRSYFKLFPEKIKQGIDLSDLFVDIFEGKVRDFESEKKLSKNQTTATSETEKQYIYKSVYERDVFFDAVITKDSNGRILLSDSITPHGKNPLKNPIPITFLKIASGCTMEFRFKLVDSFIGESRIPFTAQEKKELFKLIFKTVGAGAKTNVGYGQFE